MRGPELLTYDLGQGACAFSTERRGGYSEGAYASFNANAYCGDDERMVRLNRDLLCEALGLETSRLIIPHQIHGARVRRIDEAFFMQTDAVKAVTLEGVDAVMTDVPKVCVSVSTADCIPILIYDRVHHAVAAVHAGWRSTVLRIPEAVLQAMAGAYGTRPQDVEAAIGPGISLEAFEVLRCALYTDSFGRSVHLPPFRTFLLRTPLGHPFGAHSERYFSDGLIKNMDIW